MTTLQKFKKLLQIALENGWGSKLQIKVFQWLKYNKSDNDYEIDGLHLLCDINHSSGYFYIPINDIILDWSNNSISFLDALCEAFLEKVLKKEIQPEYGKKRLDIAIKWISKPTNERLNFLFEEFSHLLE